MPNDDDLDLDLDLDKDPPKRDDCHTCNVTCYYIPYLFAVIDGASRIIIGPAEGRMNWFTTLEMTKRTIPRASQDVRDGFGGGICSFTAAIGRKLRLQLIDPSLIMTTNQKCPMSRPLAPIWDLRLKLIRCSAPE